MVLVKESLPEKVEIFLNSGGVSGVRFILKKIQNLLSRKKLGHHLQIKDPGFAISIP